MNMKNRFAVTCRAVFLCSKYKRKKVYLFPPVIYGLIILPFVIKVNIFIKIWQSTIGFNIKCERYKPRTSGRKHLPHLFFFYTETDLSKEAG